MISREANGRDRAENRRKRFPFGWWRVVTQPKPGSEPSENSLITDISIHSDSHVTILGTVNRRSFPCGPLNAATVLAMGFSSNIDILRADAADAEAIARLHALSWRTTYVGILPDAFLEGPLDENRRALWRTRFASGSAERHTVLKAVVDGEIVGFACVLLDADPIWGSLLDNLHVHPFRKRLGIGRLLFSAARDAVAATHSLHFHLWVLAGNTSARRFYEALGGTAVEARSIEVVPLITVPEIRYVWKNFREP